MQLEFVETEETTNVLIDGTHWKTLSKKLFAKELSALLRHNSLEALEKAFSLLEQKLARRQAILWLSKKTYLTSELKSKLEDKLFSIEAVHYTLEFCHKIGAFNDADLIKSRLERKIKKGYSLKYSQMSVKQKGNQEVIPLLKEQELANAQKLLQKKLKTIDLNDFKSKNKLIAFFLRRGFALDFIKELIQKAEID